MNIGVQLLLDFLRSAWSMLAGAAIMVTLVGLLLRVLYGAASTISGSGLALGEVLGTAAGLLMLLLFGFIGVPILAEKFTGEILTMSPTACGPLKELGIHTVRILTALAAIRMLWAFTRVAGWTAVNGGRGIASAMLDAGESILGLFFVSLAGPLAGHFLGLC